ncbi:sensor histidine kinase [Anaerocolumna sp.]|uniref:sensor histidine kinase n=1 Tax=Anaerocolumna sp. TaxID=2041569 RepID=UPI0028AC8ECD|nr:Spo0B domain-containing protein [Anaerocolumna sp.]
MNIRKIVTALIVINIIQFLIGITIWITIGIYGGGINNIYAYIYVLLILLSSIITVISIYNVNRQGNDNMAETIRNLEELNTKLRAQRHDYLNHFQVIYGLMELQEYEEAIKYLEPVFKDIMKVSKALKTAQPAVNALLQVKMEAAENKNIDFFLDIRTDLKNIPMEPWNLCIVLANIIDNSITCLAEIEKKKTIYIEMDESKSNYSFQIINNGPQISEDQLTDIFKQGFTTKKEQGHGMGLYIVSKIIEDVNGTINASSNKKETGFYIQIPKVNHNRDKTLIDSKKL